MLPQFDVRCRSVEHPAMWRLAFLFAIVACGPIDQSSVQTVAAIELRMDGPAEEAALLAILKQHAHAASGLHVDDASAKGRAVETEIGILPPEDRLTVSFAVWRGENDEEPEVLADDRYHPGRIWVTFMRGSNAARSTHFRDPLVAALRARWPDARTLPILPSGAVPLAEDLVATDGRYLVRRSAAARYELPTGSPLFSQGAELTEAGLDRFEAQFATPAGARPLREYRRVYAGPAVHTEDDLPFTTLSTPMPDWPEPRTKPVGVGVFVVPGAWDDPRPAGRSITPVEDLPSRFHGGCDVINVVFDPDTGRALGGWCNVP